MAIKKDKIGEHTDKYIHIRKDIIVTIFRSIVLSVFLLQCIAGVILVPLITINGLLYLNKLGGFPGGLWVLVPMVIIIITFWGITSTKIGNKMGEWASQ